MEPFKIKPNTGGQLEPASVVGRDDFILQVAAQLREGNNILVADPRRFGKSSALERFVNEPGSGLVAVRVKVEGTNSADELLRRIIESLLRHQGAGPRLKQVFKHFLSDSTINTGPIEWNPTFAERDRVQLLGQVLAAVAQKFGDDEVLVVVLDEIPLAIESIMEHEGAVAAKNTLHVLRQARELHRSIRWVFAGSVGFHHVLNKINTTEGAISDMRTESVGPLSDEHASLLACCLLLGIEQQSDDATVEHLTLMAGNIPYLLHHLASTLGKRDVTSVSTSDVDLAFEVFINDRDDSRAMTHLLTRIDAYLGRELHAWCARSSTRSPSPNLSPPTFCSTNTRRSAAMTCSACSTPCATTTI